MSEILQAPRAREIFFPAHKCRTFHRINLEYLAPLQAMPRQQVYGLLNTGIRSNLSRTGMDDSIMQGLRPHLEWLASRVAVQSARLLKDRQNQRRQLLSSSGGDFSIYRAGMGVDFASKKLSESLCAEDVVAEQQVAMAANTLLAALATNDRNYRAHFELGWIYLFVQHKLPEAVFHLETAARQAQEYDPGFAVFARRHLADAYYGLQDFGNAAEVSLSLVRDVADPDPEFLYESSRYLAACGENGLAMAQLNKVITRSPVYHAQAQGEPDFAGNEVITGRLHEMRENRVNRIQTYVQDSWRQHALSTMPLPDQIDASHLFREVFQQHVRVMSHLPYTTLSQREKQIGDSIITASRKRIMREVSLRSRHYEQVAEKERSRWTWVNRAGGFLIHLSVVLMLAALIFHLLRFSLDLFGMGQLFGVDPLFGVIFTAMLALGVAGVTLFQFVPFGVKKLLRKQVELDNTLHVLRSS